MVVRKRLEDQTIRDNFMFAAVMMDEENCKGFLERLLHIRIDHIDVDYEKTIIYHPEYHGVRLDVYAKDENNTRYNVEMQVHPENVELRSRYYHSQIDMDVFLAGEDYDHLPDTYVIFICDYDPFDRKKYVYSVKKAIVECTDQPYDDGSYTIILSTRGENDSEISPELLRFLKFIRTDGSANEESDNDPYIEQLRNSMIRIKSNREMRKQFMLLEIMLKRERAEGREEGIKEGRTSLILPMLQHGLSVDDIAAIYGYDRDEVVRIAEEAKTNSVSQPQDGCVNP